ncbi:MAG: M23 family metallopeptidase [Coriobacteriia bacterium]|nr:M23 family metallopeptidase [Coriobacteriia bacterium]
MTESADNAVQEAAPKPQRDQATVAAIVMAVIVLCVGLGLTALFWAPLPAATPVKTPASGTSQKNVGPSSEAENPEPGSGSAATQVPAATPIFANYKSLQLHLPVAVESLSEIGFHQASYGWALPIETPLPDADMKAAKGKGTGRDATKQPSGDGATLIGSVLRMWRNGRSGEPNTAVDIAAEPGTPILAPVDGIVVLVKAYDLYGNPDIPDYEVHIRPNDMPDVDIVLIHIDNPKASAGDTVVAGVTPIGEVRKLAGKMNLQIGDYMTGEGNHTHMQVNNPKNPEYKGLEGALKIDP